MIDTRYSKNINASITDDSFTLADSNSFLSPLEILKKTNV